MRNSHRAAVKIVANISQGATQFTKCFFHFAQDHKGKLSQWQDREVEWFVWALVLSFPKKVENFFNQDIRVCHSTTTTRTFQKWVKMLHIPDQNTEIVIVLSFLDLQDQTEVEENRLIVTTDMIPGLIQAKLCWDIFSFL